MNIDLKCPERWAELTPEQVIYVAGLYNLKLARHEFLALTFLKFTGVKAVNIINIPFYRYFWHTNFALKLDKFLLKLNMQVEESGYSWFSVKKNHWELSDHFLFSYKGQKVEIDSLDFKNFCEKLAFLTDSIGLMEPPERIKGFTGPDSMIYNLTMEEYLTADIYYMTISKYPDLKHELLCKMVATLWRKKDESFTDNIPEKRFGKFMKCDKAVLNAVYLWWTGLKVYLKEEYPLVYAPGDGESSPKEMIFGLLSAFNDGKPQDNEILLKTKAHEILWELNKKIEKGNKNARS